MGKSHYLILLIVVITIALMSSWLLRSIEQSTIQETRDTRQNRDYYLDNFTATIMDTSGTPFYRLTSNHLDHYPVRNTMDLDQPRLMVYKDKNYPWTLSSETGTVFQQSNRIHLDGKVIAERPAKQASKKIVIVTKNVRILIDDETANTDHKVVMTQGKSRVEAKGMRINLRKGTLELLANVRGKYEIQRP